MMMVGDSQDWEDVNEPGSMGVANEEAVAAALRDLLDAR